MTRRLAIPLLTLALLSAPATAAEPATRGIGRPLAPVPDDRVYDRVFLLVVGIGAYPADRGVAPLDYATPDATGFRDALTSQVEVAQVVQRLDAEATRQGIFSALEDIRATMTPRDALVVFWAGHGVSSRVEGKPPLDYFVTWDGGASVSHPNNIAMAELRHQLASLPAHHKLLIVDACFAGVLARRAAPVMASSRRPPPATWTQREVFAVMTAGAEGQVVLDHGANGHSVFTGALIAALRDLDGYVTASELHLRVRDRVTTQAQLAGVQQTPIYALIDEAPEDQARPGDFVLIGSETVRLERALQAAKKAWAEARTRCEGPARDELDRALNQVEGSDLPLAERVWLAESALAAATTACR